MDYISMVLVILLLVISGLYLILFFMIRPTKLKNHELDCLLYAPIAHRGYHDRTKNDPENSMKAFRQAIEKGYNIETDLWCSKDGVPVCFHDGDTKRMCGVEGHVKDMTLEEIKNLRLAGTGEQIPTLEELLQLVDGRVSLLIEFKGNGKMGIEEKAFEQLCRYRGRYAVQAFHPLSVAWFKKHAPKVLRGQLSADFLKRKEEGMGLAVRFAMTHLLVNVISRPHFVAYDYRGVGRYEPSSIRSLHGVLFAWTVPDQESADKLAKKVDNIIFEGFEPKK